MKNQFIACLAAILSSFPLIANAYIGPGAGLSALGSLLAVVLALLVAIIGFLWFPIKRLLKTLKGNTRNHGTLESNDSHNTKRDE